MVDHVLEGDGDGGDLTCHDAVGRRISTRITSREQPTSPMRSHIVSIVIRFSQASSPEGCAWSSSEQRHGPTSGEPAGRFQASDAEDADVGQLTEEIEGSIDLLHMILTLGPPEGDPWSVQPP